MTEPQSTEIIQPQQQASAPARPDMVRFGGYDREQTDMLLERYWNQMQGYRRSLAQQLGVSDRQQTRIGQLEGQLEAAVAERDQLKHRADNPYEAAGQAAQQMVDTARDKAKGMLANAEKEAERTLAEADGKARRLVERATAELQEKSDRLDAEHAKAMRELQTLKEGLEKERQAFAARMEQEREQAARDAQARIQAATEREDKARRTVEQAREQLRALLHGLND